MADTIVMEPEALAGDEGQSAEPVETPEVVDAEQGEGSAPVETDTPSSAYEDEESASKDPVVTALLEKTRKDIEARLTKSFEDKQASAAEKARQQERQQMFAVQATQAAQWRQGEAARGIYELLQATEAQINEGKTLNDVWGTQFTRVQEMAKRIDQAAMTQAFVAIQPVVNEALLEAFPDYTAPSNLAEEFYGAVHRYDPQAIFKAVMKIAGDAADKDKRRAERVEKEVREKLENDSKVQATKAAAANRQGRTPTLDVPAGGSRKTYTLDQIDKMPTNEWLSIPQEERTRILADAHRRAARG